LTLLHFLIHRRYWYYFDYSLINMQWDHSVYSINRKALLNFTYIKYSHWFCTERINIGIVEGCRLDHEVVTKGKGTKILSLVPGLWHFLIQRLWTNEKNMCMHFPILVFIQLEHAKWSLIMNVMIRHATAPVQLVELELVRQLSLPWDEAVDQLYHSALASCWAALISSSLLMRFKRHACSFLFSTGKQ
jgi:hypothetical protein